MQKKYTKTRYFKPYIKERKPTLEKTGSGVYVIKRNDVIVYVGMSYGDVKKTLYRHFQKWTDKRNQFLRDQDGFDRVSYYGWDLSEFRVRVIFTKTGNQAEKLEQALILKYEPEQNKSKLDILKKQEREKIIKEEENTPFFEQIDEFFNIENFNPDEEIPF